VLDRPDQAEVALLDQVQERQAMAREAPGHRHHQPQVGLQQVMPGPGADLGDPLEVDALARGQPVAALGQPLFGGQASLDPLGQFGLLLGGQPGYLADLFQVLPDLVGVARFRVLGGRCGEIGREQVLGVMALP